MKIERERFEIFKAKKGTDVEELRRVLKWGEEIIGDQYKARMRSINLYGDSSIAVQLGEDVYLISYYAYGKKPEVRPEKVAVDNMDKYQEVLMKFFDTDIPMINDGPSNTFWIEPKD
ncbi:MAG TPA: hypothetical protein VN132_10620 [Bdellovibrio sp.]|nr:hypothetical protein [Bdellovibrio sp.]